MLLGKLTPAPGINESTTRVYYLKELSHVTCNNIPISKNEIHLRVNHHLPHFKLVKLRTKPPLQTESTLYVYKAFISRIFKENAHSHTKRNVLHLVSILRNMAFNF